VPFASLGGAERYGYPYPAEYRFDDIGNIE